MPVGPTGGSVTRLGGGSGAAPGTDPSGARNRQRMRYAGRAALGAASPVHPSAARASPTSWYAGQPARRGRGRRSPARSLRSSERSANRASIDQDHKSRGIAALGGMPASARCRYHSAHAVSSVSAGEMASTVAPRCHADRGLALAPPHHSRQPGLAHQPGDALAARTHAAVAQLGVHARPAVGGLALAVNHADLLEQFVVAALARRCRPVLPGVVAGSADAEHAAHRRRDAVASSRRSAGRTSPAIGLPREESRSRLEDLALLRQPAVLAPQPPQLLALVGGQAFDATGVDVALAAPVTQRLLR